MIITYIFSLFKLIKSDKFFSYSLYKKKLKEIFFFKYLTNIKEGFFIKNFLSLFIGNFSGQIVIILSSPLLSRLYSPSDFGLLELILSIFSIVSVAANLKLENAIVTQKTNEEAHKVLSLCFSVNLLIFLLGILVLWALNIMEFNFFIKVFGSWWWVPPLLGWFSGIQQAIQMYFIRNNKYKIISVILFLQAIGLISFQLLYGYLTVYDSSTLILGYIANNSIVCFIFFIFLIKKENIQIITHLKTLFLKACECKNFIFYTVPTSLLGAISQRSFFLTLGIFFAESDVGFASLAIRVMYSPLTLITRSMGHVFFGLFSEKRNDAEFTKKINKIIQWKIISVSLIIPVILNAPYIFEFCFGSQWREAGYYAMLLSPAAFMLFLTAWLDRTHDVASLQKKAFSLELGYNISLVSGMILVSNIFNSPFYLIGFFGFFTASYNILWLGLTMKIIGISYKNSLNNLLLLMTCIAVSLLFYLFLHWSTSSLLFSMFFYYLSFFLASLLLFRQFTGFYPSKIV